MFSVENRCGRLIEIRIESPMTLEEAKEFTLLLHSTNRSVDGRVINAVDVTRANVFPAEVIQHLIQGMSEVSDRIERSAFLIGPSAIFAMQVERALQEAGAADRRAFRDVDEMADWLCEISTEAEAARVRSFLSGRSGETGDGSERD